MTVLPEYVEGSNGNQKPSRLKSAVKSLSLKDERKAHSNQQCHQHRSRHPSWTEETAALVAATACLVGMIGLLSYYQNKQMPHWTTHVSLNTVISLLTTAAKGTIAFTVASCISQLKWNHYTSSTPRNLYDFEIMDGASRGPIGALELLWHLPMSFLAWIAAALTLITLAFDPFNQQIAKYTTRNQWIPSHNASYPIAHKYDTGTSGKVSGSTDVVPVPAEADWKMQGAILNGIYNQNMNPKFNCSTNNCRWLDSQITLGFGRTCSNVTQATLASKDDNGNATTPGGVKIPIGDTSNEDADYSAYISTNTYTPSYSDNQMLDDRGNMSVSPDIVSIAEYRTSDPTKGAIQQQVLECMISFVAYRMTGVESAGGSFNVDSMHQIPLHNGSVNGEINSSMIIFNNNTQQDNKNKDSDSAGLPLFKVNIFDLQEIATFLSQQLTGISISNMIGIDTPPTSGPILALTSPEAGNITVWSNRIVTSMTNELRSQSTMHVNGEASVPLIFVEVTWGWVVLSLAALAACILFLAFTVWRNRGIRKATLWKSSVLSLLFYRLETEDDSKTALVSDFHSPDTLKAVAKSTTVRIGGVH